MIASSSLARRPEDGRFHKVAYSQGSSQSSTGCLEMPTIMSGGPVTAHPTPLRGDKRSLLPPLMDESLCVGGLKEAWKACRKLWMHRSLGLELKALIETYLDKAPQIVDDLNNLIGASDASIDHLEPHIGAVRQLCAEHFARRLGRSVSCEPVSGEYTNQFRGDFMQAWAQTAKDPALKVVSWLTPLLDCQLLTVHTVIRTDPHISGNRAVLTISEHSCDNTSDCFCTIVSSQTRVHA